MKYCIKVKNFVSIIALFFLAIASDASAHENSNLLQPLPYISSWDDNYPDDLSSDGSHRVNKPSPNTTQYEHALGHVQTHKSTVLESYGQLVSLGGTPVISSPFVNMYENYSGSDFIVNYSSINKDLAALRQRKRYENLMFQKAQVKHIRLPLIELSGELETQIYTLEDFDGDHANDIDLTAAELDIQALVTPWITGFMAFDYNNSPPGSGHRISNSNVYLDSGFITFGNLNYFDGYVTFGQLYMPFGQFDSYSITSPFNKTLFRTKARGINLGYKTSPLCQGFYGQVFAFKGDSRRGSYDPMATARARSATINQYGGNGGYIFHKDNGLVNLGVSYINNVTDASGMQDPYGSADRFAGFGASTATEVIQHPVAGLDIRGEIGYGRFLFINEYTTTLRSFDALDLTSNGHGARPYGYHAEGVYKFNVYGRPSTFALAYDQSGDALALNVPRRGYGATFNFTVWRSTFLSIEARHNENYGSNHSASGHGGAVFGPLGKNFNSLIGQLDIYF